MAKVTKRMLVVIQVALYLLLWLLLTGSVRR